MTDQWIIKLGGSLFSSNHLAQWLDALSETSAIIVPGGGPFADAVRQAQARWQFDEPTAHHLAILAMQQYGRMLAGLCPRLSVSMRLDVLTQCLNQATVWLPNPEELDAAGIPASWDITSDSLAAWLAGQVHAKHLLLVKSVAELDGPFNLARKISLAEAAAWGWVDPAFPRFAMNPSFQTWICGPQGYGNLHQGFTRPTGVFSLLRQVE